MNLHQALKKHFYFISFRDNQEDVIKSVLSGNDTVLISPTGGGKSLCFQLPALLLPGLTLVISPLISLMKDQVDQLNSKGIPAAYINSTNNTAEKREIIRKLANNETKLLYCSPEKLRSERFIEYLKSLKISLFAIDESHSISMWGNSFRRAYSELGILRKIKPNIPIITLTATATPSITKETIDSLAMKEPNRFIGSFDRKNLLIEVRKKTNLYTDLYNLYSETYNTGSNIIYCISKEETVEASLIIDSFDVHRGKSDYYHGGRKDNDRFRIQNDFMAGKITDLSATSAFGMGIDKPDVRVVCHPSMPQSMADYQQQIGRAGRDGILSKCVLYYDEDDISRWEYIIDMATKINESDTQEEAIIKLKHREAQRSELYELASYCESDICRRVTILDHFGEDHPGNCDKCDICI